MWLCKSGEWQIKMKKSYSVSRALAVATICIAFLSFPVDSASSSGLPNPENLTPAIQLAIADVLSADYPNLQLTDIAFDGKSLTLNLSGVARSEDTFFSALLSRINLKVNDVFASHHLHEQRNLDYFILINGQPLFPLAPEQAVRQGITTIENKKIVLSPGHGWYDTGSGWSLQRSYYWGIVEDFINADLVIELKALFSGIGADIRPTRELNPNAGNHSSGHPWWQIDASEYVRSLGAPESVWKLFPIDGTYNHDIAARPEYGNWIGADAMVSIHNNGGGGCGTETWYDTSNAYAAQSQQLANLVQNKLIERLRAQWNAGWCNRGVKGSNGGYGENRRFLGPAVIVELAFMDTQSDNTALQNAAFRSIAMTAVRDALIEYFGGVATPVLYLPLIQK